MLICAEDDSFIKKKKKEKASPVVQSHYFCLNYLIPNISTRETQRPGPSVPHAVSLCGIQARLMKVSTVPLFPQTYLGFRAQDELPFPCAAEAASTTALIQSAIM